MLDNAQSEALARTLGISLASRLQSDASTGIEQVWNTLTEIAHPKARKA